PSVRVTVTSVVSKSGTVQTRRGASAAVAPPDDAASVYAAPSPASAPPRNRLPQSPMKILAGLAFHARNPSAAPATAAARAASANAPSRTNSTEKPSDATTATPAAAPSMLSRRFHAL